MNEKLKNAVIINGEVYALYDDPELDECTRCALREDCGSDSICIVVFRAEECIGKRFYRIELY